MRFTPDDDHFGVETCVDTTNISSIREHTTLNLSIYQIFKLIVDEELPDNDLFNIVKEINNLVEAQFYWQRLQQI